ncbi:MAG: HlyC/CorC family transporter [Deltaproteobacteria bacterium]|nr:MAG: HlyC/CorC family transporter [Deltaproteobacteria bacterium]
MIATLTLLGVGIAVCLIAEAFFSGSEIAMVNADRLKLATMSNEGNHGARLALKLLSREDLLLGTCLIGTNLSTVTGATFVVTIMTTLNLELGLLAGVVYTPLTLVFGESLPKTIFQHHATRIVPFLAYPLNVAETLFYPALLLVGAWTRLLDRLLGPSQAKPVSREEIVDLLGDESHTSDGGIAEEDRRLIRRVFEISETPVEEVMTPLVDVQAMSQEATIAEAGAMAVTSGYSRLPIYRDRVDNIVGIVHVSGLLFAPDPDGPVASLMEPAIFVPEFKRVDHLLTELRQRRDPLAVVVDEYGGSVGIVTIEDLLEEILGEIRDERDGAEPLIQRLGEREWRVPARAEIEEVSDALGLPLPEGDYETIAGLVLTRTGRIPVKGETLKIEGLTLIVEESTDRSIVSLRVVTPLGSP